MRYGTQEQNLPQIHPKPSPNAPKILPKPFLNPPKTLPEPFQNPPSKRNAKKNRFFLIFFNFWRARGFPKSSQNRKRSEKKLKKSKLKNHMFFNCIFFEFSPFWPPKTQPKLSFFCYFFENVDFVEIMVFPQENSYFSGLGPPKIHRKSMPTRSRKKHRKKNLAKIDFRLHFGLPNPPKIVRKSSEKRR